MCQRSIYDKKAGSLHKETKHGKPSILKVIKPNQKQRVNEEIVKEIEGELSMENIMKDLNTLMNTGKPSSRDKKFIKIMKNIARLKDECNECGHEETNSDYLHSQRTDEHESKTESIFLSHHDEEFDASEIELSSEIWNIFLSDEVGKELTEEEKKEILKLHKFFCTQKCKKALG